MNDVNLKRIADAMEEILRLVKVDPVSYTHLTLPTILRV